MNNHSKEANKFVMHLLHDRFYFKNESRFLKISIKNSHPFIFFTPYNSKFNYAALHFFKNQKIKLLIKNNFYCRDNYLFDDVFFKNSKELNKFIYSKLPFDFHYENSFLLNESHYYKSGDYKLNDVPEKTPLFESLVFSKLYISSLLSHLVFNKNKFSSVYFDNGIGFNENSKFHIRNDFLKIYGYISFCNDTVNLYRKIYNSKDNKIIYSINLKDYINDSSVKEFFLTKELKKMCSIIKKQF